MSSSFYYHFMFVVTLLSCIIMSSNVSRNKIVYSFGKTSVIFLLFVVIYFIFALPIPWNTNADRELYANQFIWIQQEVGESWDDRLFSLYVKICSTVVDYSAWFLLTAFIYCYNHYQFAYKLSKEYAYIIILMFFTSFMFYSYGTNTIRAGFAASFLLLALVNYKHKIYLFFYLLIAVGCHASMLIPASAIVVSSFFNRTRFFIYVWFVSIILSVVLGSYFEMLFSSMAFDSRVHYLNVAKDDTHYNVGFRIDFILYSCLPIVAGYYYVVKKKYRDEMYSLLLNTYILANSFWILVIRANFSDRFAYLSWFIYPVILIYPMLKQRFVSEQYKIIIGVVFLHELFTYIMYLIK